jgi:hypothetical protein
MSAIDPKRTSRRKKTRHNALENQQPTSSPLSFEPRLYALQVFVPAINRKDVNRCTNKKATSDEGVRLQSVAITHKLLENLELLFCPFIQSAYSVGGVCADPRELLLEKIIQTQTTGAKKADST